MSLTVVLCQGDGLRWYQIEAQNCLRGSKQIPEAGIVSFSSGSHLFKPHDILIVIQFFLADLIADILLFLAPSFMLRKIKLPKDQRRLILAAFSASILTLLSAIVFCIFWYGRLDLGPDHFLLRTMVGHLEVSGPFFDFLIQRNLKLSTHE